MSVPAIHDVLDAREAAVVEHALTAFSTAGATAALGEVESGIERLRLAWRAVDTFPRLSECQTLGSRHRNLDTLVDTFSTLEPYTIEASLPTRASLSRAYAMAKFNFCRMLGYVVADRLADGPTRTGLLAAVGELGAAAATAIIAEDVLRSIVCDTQQKRTVRAQVTRVLADLWDQRATRGVTEFSPLLASAWQAKSRVRVHYGTLAGVSETMQMLGAGLDPEFVAACSVDGPYDGPSNNALTAFEEFLFNATYEELGRMRAHMAEHGQPALGAADVAKIFGVPADRLHTTTATPQAMFFTFREREMWARLRRLRGLPGPHRTAEEYGMLWVLSRGAGSPP